MIEIKNLRKEYKSVTPIKNISTIINDGDVISIIGPSGTGKSTFLRCINQLEKPTSGQIFLDGEEITAAKYNIKNARKKIGMVFQSFNLFGHLTVIENLMLSPMDLLKKNKQEAYDIAIKYLRRVGLADKAMSYPDELSGGQMQRVAIARTLCMDPDVILLDEPTSALDPTMVSEVQAVIRDLSKSGKTMMIVTHEMNFARAISNRIFYMDQGGIYEEGSPDQIFDNPQGQLTKNFVQGLKIFSTEIESKDFDFMNFEIELNQYLAQNDADSSMKYRIRLVVEETIRQLIMPHYKHPSISLKIEYSLKYKNCNVTIDYGDDKFDIKDSKNELSLILLEKISEKISYSYKEDEKRKNHLTISIIDN